jgi:hypothetical protein
MHFASEYGMIRGIVADVTKGMQLFDAFVVSGFGTDLCLLHYIGPGDVHRVLKTIAVPVMIQQAVHTDMRSMDTIIIYDGVEKNGKCCGVVHGKIRCVEMNYY